jgi:hypothetical protein
MNFERYRILVTVQWIPPWWGFRFSGRKGAATRGYWLLYFSPFGFSFRVCGLDVRWRTEGETEKGK